VLRVLPTLALGLLLLWSCGPDNQRTCSGEDPAFKVVLKLSARPLPADLVVRVAYAGAGKEVFRLADPNARHEVTFCHLADETGTPLDASTTEGIEAGGAAGAGGAAPDTGNPGQVAALYCELWTAGFTELNVSGTGFVTMDYDLTPKRNQCTVQKELVLDSPDAG